MALQYRMRAYKTLAPVGYVYWTVYDEPDFLATYSGYSLANLQNVAVNRIIQTKDAYVNFDIVFANSPVSAPVYTSVTYVYNCDTTGGAIVLNLPVTVTENSSVIIKDSGNYSATNNITVNGNGNNIDGAASLVLNINGVSYTLLYTGGKWNVV